MSANNLLVLFSSSDEGRLTISYLISKRYKIEANLVIPTLEHFEKFKEGVTEFYYELKGRVEVSNADIYFTILKSLRAHFSISNESDAILYRITQEYLANIHRSSGKYGGGGGSLGRSALVQRANYKKQLQQAILN
jgi:hypothetical protein